MKVEKYKWSKEIINKINNAKIFDENELCTIEIALRMYDVCNDILDESVGLSKENKYELQHKC